MDDKGKSAGMSEKVDNRSDNKPEIYSSLPGTSKSTLNFSAGQTGSVTEVNSFSEQIFTEDTELSSSEICVHVFPHTTTAKCEGQTAAAVCPHSAIEKDQPRTLHALLPPSVESRTVLEVSRPFKSISKSQESLKTSTVHNEPQGDDLCAAILLACLFCQPLDCLLATIRGCNGCLWWLCSSLCGCEPTSLQPVLEVARHCNVCGCLDLRCFTCDCPVCDICLQATECLDLAMEISQMLYH